MVHNGEHCHDACLAWRWVPASTVAQGLVLSDIPWGLWVCHGESVRLPTCTSLLTRRQQFLLAAGLQYEKSSRATNMVYVQMLFALSFDKLIWGTTPGTLSIIGSSLILGSAIYVAMHKEAPTKAGVERETGDQEEGRGLMATELDMDRDDDRRGIPLTAVRN
jgi:hypothetical protein